MPSSPLSSELTASMMDTNAGGGQGSVVLPSTNSDMSQASDEVLKRDTSPSILVESPAAASASGGVSSVEVVPLNSSSSSPSRTNRSPNNNNSRSRSLSPKQGPSATTIDSIVATSPPLSAATAAGAAAAPTSSTLPHPNQSSRNSSQRQFSASRPSPVVPASVPGSPSFSRPNSPRPGLGREREKSDGELPSHPTSPTRASHHHPFSSQVGHGSTSATNTGSGSGGASLSRSGSAMDLSHIFERDVEFSGTHHISPQEAVDVAIPPVLSEAAVALLSPEGNLSSTEIASLVRESEGTTSSSGWDLPPTLPPSPLVQQHRFSALSSPSESTSPDSELFDGVHMAGTGSGPLSAPTPPSHRRAASPRGSGSGSSKYLHTPSTSPPSSMSSSWAGIGGAAGAGAGGGGGGGPGDVMRTSPTNSTARLSSSPGRGPAGITTTTTTNTISKSSASPSRLPFLELQQSASLFGSNVSPGSSGVFGENVLSGASVGGGGGGGGTGTLDTTSVGSVSTPRRLSFLSYSDIINEERLAELQGSPIGGPQSIPVGGGGIGGVSGGGTSHHQGSSSTTTNIINVGGGGGGALTPSRIASAATPLDLSSLMRSLQTQGSPHPGA